MQGMIGKLLATTALLTLVACGETSTSWDAELGAEVDKGQFGNATMNNTLLQTGQMEYTVALAQRFAAEVPDTVTFAFNSAQITGEAAAVLDKQANFIRQFPEVRFKVFGHTDLVGSQGYNYNLGLRAAPMPSSTIWLAREFPAAAWKRWSATARPARSSRRPSPSSATAAR